MTEKYYVVTPTEEGRKKKTEICSQMCAINGEVIALTTENFLGQILCEGSLKQCQDFFSNWIQQRNKIQ